MGESKSCWRAGRRTSRVLQDGTELMVQHLPTEDREGMLLSLSDESALLWVLNFCCILLSCLLK